MSPRVAVPSPLHVGATPRGDSRSATTDVSSTTSTTGTATTTTKTTPASARHSKSREQPQSSQPSSQLSSQPSSQLSSQPSSQLSSQLSPRFGACQHEGVLLLAKVDDNKVGEDAKVVCLDSSDEEAMRAKPAVSGRDTSKLAGAGFLNSRPADERNPGNGMATAVRTSKYEPPLYSPGYAEDSSEEELSSEEYDGDLEDNFEVYVGFKPDTVNDNVADDVVQDLTMLDEENEANDEIGEESHEDEDLDSEMQESTASMSHWKVLRAEQIDDKYLDDSSCASESGSESQNECRSKTSQQGDSASQGINGTFIKSEPNARSMYISFRPAKIAEDETIIQVKAEATISGLLCPVQEDTATVSTDPVAPSKTDGKEGLSRQNQESAHGLELISSGTTESSTSTRSASNVGVADMQRRHQGAADKDTKVAKDSKASQDSISDVEHRAVHGATAQPKIDAIGSSKRPRSLSANNDDVVCKRPNTQSYNTDAGANKETRLASTAGDKETRIERQCMDDEAEYDELKLQDFVKKSTAEIKKSKIRVPRSERCEKTGCKRAKKEGAGGLCAKHAKRGRCLREDCDKVAAEGGTKLCYAHGGGKSCRFIGCDRRRVELAGGFCNAHKQGTAQSGQKRDVPLRSRVEEAKASVAPQKSGLCRVKGCSKWAKWGGTQHCAAHGGGKRCLEKGCDKGAQSGPLQRCVRHGGGKRCSEPGCNLTVVTTPYGREYCRKHSKEIQNHQNLVESSPASAISETGANKGIASPSREAQTAPKGSQACQRPRLSAGVECTFPGCRKRRARCGKSTCCEHGGGAQCVIPGCKNRASRTGCLCKRHFADQDPLRKLRRLCRVEGCPSAAQRGKLCILHGGGLRCQEPGCTKSVAPGPYKKACTAHGGGKRCEYSGCKNGAKKGGLCRAHGGGQMCSIEGCTTSVQLKGRCAAHSRLLFCSVVGCMDIGRFYGTRCLFHRFRCKHDGCFEYAKRNHFCLEHSSLTAGTTTVS